LKSLDPINWIRDVSLNWSSKYRYDFVNEQTKLIIEVDGMHHFKRTRFGSFKKYRSNDIIKLNLALLNGYSIIRIFQKDIINKKINWKELLLQTIPMMKSNTIGIICHDPLQYYKWVGL
jgi:very-short-patch-repair endonuclease